MACSCYFSAQGRQDGRRTRAPCRIPGPMIGARTQPLRPTRNQDGVTPDRARPAHAYGAQNEQPAVSALFRDAASRNASSRLKNGPCQVSFRPECAACVPRPSLQYGQRPRCTRTRSCVQFSYTWYASPCLIRWARLRARSPCVDVRPHEGEIADVPGQHAVERTCTTEVGVVARNPLLRQRRLVEDHRQAGIDRST